MKYFNSQIVNPDRVPAGHVPTSLTPEQRARAEAAKAGKTSQTSDTAAAPGQKTSSNIDLQKENLEALCTVNGKREPETEVFSYLSTMKQNLGDKPMTKENVKEMLIKQYHLPPSKAEVYSNEIFEQMAAIKNNPKQSEIEIGKLKNTINRIDTEPERKSPVLTGLNEEALGRDTKTESTVTGTHLRETGEKKDNLRNVIAASDEYLAQTGKSNLDETNINALAKPLAKSLGTTFEKIKAENPKMTNRQLLEKMLSQAKDVYKNVGEQYEVQNSKLFFEGKSEDRFLNLYQAPTIKDEVSGKDLDKAITDYLSLNNQIKNGRKVSDEELRNVQQNGRYLLQAAEARLGKAVFFTAKEQQDVKDIRKNLEQIDWRLSGKAGEAITKIENQVVEKSSVLLGQVGLDPGNPAYKDAAQTLLRAYPDLKVGENGKAMLAEIIKNLAEGKGIRKIAHLGLLMGEFDGKEWKTGSEVKCLRKFIEIARKNLGEDDGELRELEKYDLTDAKLEELYRKDNSLGGIFARYEGGQFEGNIRISLEDLKVAGVENYQFSAAAAVLSGGTPKLYSTDQTIPVNLGENVINKLPEDLRPKDGKWTFAQFEKINKQHQVLHALPSSERMVAVKPDQVIQNQLQVINLIKEDLTSIAATTFDRSKMDTDMPVIRLSDLDGPPPEGASEKFKMMHSFYSQLKDVHVEDRRYSPAWRSALIVTDGVVTGIDAGVLARSGKINVHLQRIFTEAAQFHYDKSGGVQMVVDPLKAATLYFCLGRADETVTNQKRAVTMSGPVNEQIKNWAANPENKNKFTYKHDGIKTAVLTVTGNMTQAERDYLTQISKTPSEKTNIAILYDQSAVAYSQPDGITAVLHRRSANEVRQTPAKVVFMNEKKVETKSADGTEMPASTGETGALPAEANAPSQAPAKPAPAQKKSKTKSTAPAVPAKPPKQPAGPDAPQQNMAVNLQRRAQTNYNEVLAEFKTKTSQADRNKYLSALYKNRTHNLRADKSLTAADKAYLDSIDQNTKIIQTRKQEEAKRKAASAAAKDPSKKA